MTAETRGWSETVSQFTERSSKQVRDTRTCYCHVPNCLSKEIPQDGKIRERMGSFVLLAGGRQTC